MNTHSAAALTAGEGIGKTWCGSYGGTNLGSYKGVYACELTGTTSSAGKTPFDFAPGFQCTELANRYLYSFNGDTEFDSVYNGGNLVGGNFVSSVAAQYSITTGSSGESALPVAGDIISMWGGSSGQPQNGPDSHVAIVTGTSAGAITILNQNADPSTNIDAPPPGGSGFSTISISGSSWSTNGGFYTSFQWLNLKPEYTPPPTVTNFTATPSTLTSAGGQVTLSANATNATSCTFTSSQRSPASSDRCHVRRVL